ncbi:S1 family peptidase [Streptomyces sp. NPDC017056]|uniref:S1 family peptidase n=1 Tax=Streptomyces sp. NPDC017056 TaxID=3364973 RepID=UPI00378CB548
MRPRPTTVLHSLAALALATLATLATTPPADAAPTAIRGGNVLYGAAGRCTVGFNATKGNTYYALMEGRCADGNRDWYADAARTVHVGVTEAVRFPGDDYAVIRYTNPAVSYPGEIDLGGGRHLDVTGAARPVVGQSLCLAGTTGTRCGRVLAVNASVSYPEGTVHGVTRAGLCTERGETAGRPAHSGRTAIGVTIGATGDCASGGESYLQPVVPALAAFGLTLH